MSPPANTLRGLSRRDFLAGSAALVGAGAVRRAHDALSLSKGAFDVSARDKAEKAEKGISIGIFTDSHYADRDRAGGRHYRDSAAKLTEFVRTMNRLQPAFAIVLGDFVDKGRSLEVERGYLKRIEGIFRTFKGPRHHVIGNHDVATFSKEQYADGTGMPGPHYSFDAGPYHCIVLDANYRKDFSPYKAGNFNWTQTYVPPREQKWLEADLIRTKKKVVAFIHQTLDDEGGSHGVKNAPEVRQLLEKSGKVLAVFQGHNHGGAYRKIKGIEYFTLRAMVEGPGLKNNSYSLVRVGPDGIRVRGFGKQPASPPKRPGSGKK